jgi:hypothetical protein
VDKNIAQEEAARQSTQKAREKGGGAKISGAGIRRQRFFYSDS